MKLRDLKVHKPKVEPARCAVCGAPLFGKGWFCSYACDEAERLSRNAHAVGVLLRRLLGADHA